MSGMTFLTVVIFRVGQYTHASRSPVALMLRPLWFIINLIYVEILLGSSMPPTVHCAPGLILQHMGRGVIIDPHVVIGKNLALFQQTTLSSSTTGPIIGDHVLIGTRSVIYGDISVGDGAKIGMLSSVTEDVPAGFVVVGVPGKARPGKSAG